MIEAAQGTRIPAGCSYSTVLADMDFETYSSAGYVYHPEIEKWVPLNTSGKAGLSAVGASVYSEHESTEVLSLAYNLKLGDGAKLWIPGMPPPLDLFEHLANGGLIEAWNSLFEYYIWLNVCAPRMGWPELPLHQLRDAMAKSRTFSLPGALADAGKATGIANQKIKGGTALLNKFSKPRKPTIKDKRLRILPHEDPQKGAELYAYNLGDIKAESDMSAICPDLSPDELDLWLLDQTINTRGMYIDVEAMRSCKNIVEQALAKYNKELIKITGGACENANKLAKMQEWICTQGINLPDMTADTLKDALNGPLPANVRRVLEIRQNLGSASVKKLFALDRRLSKDGRLRDMFAFYAAHTGRWTGQGPQPQNLPNSGPDVYSCPCGRHYGAHRHDCPHCGREAPPESIGWCMEAVWDALAVIDGGTLDYVEDCFGDALPLISGCLRALFSAAPGHELICSDYSAIEAVVLAVIAKEEWRIEVFRTHGMIYEMSASKITGVPFEEFVAYKERTGEHHPFRKKIGKVSELACFGLDTLVLTPRGYVEIVDIKLSDKLWDGIEWVIHSGVVLRGRRDVITVDGVKVTPDHPVSINGSWTAAKLLVSRKNILTRALATGSANLPCCALNSIDTVKAQLCNAPAGTPPTSQRSQISASESLLAAVNAGVKNLAIHTSNFINVTRIYSRMMNTVDVYLIGFLRLKADAITRKIGCTPTMEAVGLKCARLGEKTPEPSYPTSLLYRVLTSLNSIWTGQILTGIMNPVIFDSSLEAQTHLTSGPSLPCRKESTSLNTVYDIANAGPLHRFTIKTKSGHLLVHNSGYQGSVGAWKQFGADKHFNSDEEILAAVRVWRKDNPMIVKFWYGLEDAAKSAIHSPGESFSYSPTGSFVQGDITFGVRDDVLYCQLPSGRSLKYHKPRLTPGRTDWGKDKIDISYMGQNNDSTKGPIGWLRRDTYGGKLTENVVQAIARDLLAFALQNLERAGYPIVLHVHDEPVSEVPEGHGSIEEFERIASATPPWANGWPVKVSGGWRGKQYRKD